MNLFKYQSNFCKKITRDIIEFVQEGGSGETFVAKAPTGAGKTIMLGHSEGIMPKVCEKIECAYIWVSPRKLHEQSAKKLKNLGIKCYFIEDIDDHLFESGSCLMLNWDIVNKAEINKFRQDNEKNNNLQSVIDRFIKSKITIGLIVDESHQNLSSNRSQEIIDIIKPTFILDVSATPDETKKYITIREIKRQEVIEAGVIKKKIIINDGFENAKSYTDEFVITSGIEKIKELKQIYDQTNCNINPLLCIQLPDKKKDEDDKLEEILKFFKDKLNWTSSDGGEIAIWLSNDKRNLNLEKISNHFDPVKVIIFKSAPVLGWDCPRAQVLVILRNMADFTFSTQTVGRILRMPELKHYENESLNNAYVFTNLEKVESRIDKNEKEYIVENLLNRKEIYKDIKLKNIHIRRQRESNRLSGRFVDIFKENKPLNINLDLYPEIKKAILSNCVIENIDKEFAIKGTEYINLTEPEDIQREYDKFLIEIIKTSPYSEYDSCRILKNCIGNFLKLLLGTQHQFNHLIVLNNKKIFEKQIKKCIEIYKQEQIKTPKIINVSGEPYKEFINGKIKENNQIFEYFEIPKSDNRKKSKTNYKKSITDGVAESDSEVEEKFMNYIDNNEKVEWWYKNGSNESKYLAILYYEDDMPKQFFPDFLIMSKNGNLAICDTKDGMTAKDKETTLKSEALQKHIEKENENRTTIHLCGGIVVPTNNDWKIYKKHGYNYDAKNLINWEPFEDIL